MMRMLGALLIVLGAALFSSSPPAQAEPWLSTRYAQNCAGCHAPGRKNVEAMDRRCTLSCQGCHVNPNGGGLRSFYGKWNEERWLRSFRLDALANARSFAPVGKQHYGRKGEKYEDQGGKSQAKLDKKKKPQRRLAGTDGEGKASDDGDEDEAPVRKKIRKPGRFGFPLVESDITTMPESDYTRADGLERVTAKDQEEWAYQVPQQDPWRLMDLTKANAGADVRWELTNYKSSGKSPDGTDVDGKSTWHSFFMAADFALEYRPLYRGLHLVYEARMQGYPQDGKNYEEKLGTAKTRSLYMMVDDLPFNTFVMTGYYRPLFGNFVPDHYALAQEITSYGMSGDAKNYDLLYNAVSLGTAPNVPYLNVHLINKKIGDRDDKTKGFAANLGLRFVTLGGSLNYSYWRTEDKRSDTKTGVEMHSIGVAAKIWRVVSSLEAVSVQRDVDTQDYRQGGVTTLDTYTQLWLENYLTLMVAKANTTTKLTPGSADQMKVGVRSFILPGVDVMLALENTKETTKEPTAGTSTSITTSGYSGQLHLYF